MGAQKQHNMGNTTTREEVLSTTVERVEYWTRPLVSAVASSLGGKHSFVVVALKDGTRHLVEKHHDGKVEWKTVSQKERVALELHKARDGYEKQHIACDRVLRPGITLDDLKQAAAAHDGYYDVHESNCHLCSQTVWNSAVTEEKQLQVEQQRHLSKLAQWMGVGGSMRAHAAATEQQQQSSREQVDKSDANTREALRDASCSQTTSQYERYVSNNPDYRLRGIASF